MSSHAPPGSTAEDVAPLFVRANKLDLLERLADDLAHEIKNPLHSMVINLEVLKRRLANPALEGAGELLRYVGVLNAEIERVNRRIELLLRMTRPERPGEPVTLNELLEELLELLQLEASRRDLKIRFEPAPHAIRVAAPRETTRQVILNLALEAVDASGRGETLTLRTERDSTHARVMLEGGSPLDADGSRLAAARMLSESVGGQVDPGPPIVFALPLRT